MTTFSNILDISSFFIGVLVNLLLVALICFYFKRKIDNLEMSQSEQAKMLFQLIQQKESNPSPTGDAPMLPGGAYNMLNGLDLSQLNEEDDEEDNNAVNGESSEDDDDDSSSDEEEEDDEEKGEEIKKIEYEEVKEELDIEKMTVKEIRNLLENKGVQVQKKNIKKQELIDLYNKGVDVPVEEVIETVVKVEEVEEVLELDHNGVGDISPEIIIDE
tara:strand:+ start:717 stop:1364 length:648 start_codon:yes stop_codon:yes gene_type:complete